MITQIKRYCEITSGGSKSYIVEMVAWNDSVKDESIKAIYNSEKELISPEIKDLRHINDLGVWAEVANPLCGMSALEPNLVYDSKDPETYLQHKRWDIYAMPLPEGYRVIEESEYNEAVQAEIDKLLEEAG